MTVTSSDMIGIIYLCYRRPPIIRVHDKVMIPQEEHPDINFVGLLIGPRGNTLKGNIVLLDVFDRCPLRFEV